MAACRRAWLSDTLEEYIASSNKKRVLGTITPKISHDKTGAGKRVERIFSTEEEAQQFLESLRSQHELQDGQTDVICESLEIVANDT